MAKRCLKAGVSFVAAFVLVAASVLWGASEALGQNSGDLSKWSESSSRKAGTRQTLKVGKVEVGLVWIPAGEFEMGSPESEEFRVPGRKPGGEELHRVKLTKGFWMLETETTQALYKEVMGTNPSKGHYISKGAERDNLPVESVSWNDAMNFCAELTKRLPAGLKATLPTEAQWEYACRAGTKTAYWYGDSADSDKMNYGKKNDGLVLSAVAVKSYAPNPWGLYDMHGNVKEWTSDYYWEYPKGMVVDPKGPDRLPFFTTPLHVIRGGSFYVRYPWTCRSASRDGDEADKYYNDTGFRVLLSCD